MCKQEAALHSKEVTIGRYKTAPKMKINRNEYYDTMFVTYLMGETNLIKDIMNILKKHPEDNCEIILGDLQIMLQDSWNAMANNAIGKRFLTKMSLEDIIDERDVSNFVKGKEVKTCF